MKKLARTTAAALAIASMVALSACQSSEPVAATSSSPAQNMVAPEAPEVPEKATKESYQEFVTYWNDVRNYAFATGDTEALAAISSKDCKGCQNQIKNVSGVYERGEWFVGREQSIEGFKTELKANDAGKYPSTFKRTIAKGARFGTNDADESVEKKKLGAVNQNLRFVASFDAENGWKVEGMANAGAAKKQNQQQKQQPKKDGSEESGEAAESSEAADE